MRLFMWVLGAPGGTQVIDLGHQCFKAGVTNAVGGRRIVIRRLGAKEPEAVGTIAHHNLSQSINFKKVSTRGM